MDAENTSTNRPLAEIKSKLGKEFYDFAFYLAIQLLTLPSFAKVYSKHSKEGIKHMVEVLADLASMIFESERHFEMEEVLLRANTVHASLGIPRHQILEAIATFAIAVPDWLKSNTTIPFGDREERDLLNCLAEVGRLMNIQETPQSISEYRDVFSSSCNKGYCPVARHLLLKGMWAYWKLQGFRRVPFALIIFPATVPSNLHGVFGIPPLPARFYRFIQNMLRVRWGIDN